MSRILAILLLLCGPALADATISNPLPGKAPVQPNSDMSTTRFANIFCSAGLNCTAATMSGTRDIVWGCSSVYSPVYCTFYYPSIRDADTNHDLAWYQANHPDWLLYLCDRTTPAKGNAGNLFNLNFTLQSVRDYIMGYLSTHALSAGFPGVAFDNVTVANNVLACGYYSSGNPPGGTWVTLFSGVRDNDAAYVSAITDWISYAWAHVNTMGMTLTINCKFNTANFTGSQILCSKGDVWLWEGGWIRATLAPECRYLIVDYDWLSYYNWIKYQQRAHGTIQINQLCDHQVADMTHAEISYMTANYFLIREGRSYIAVRPPQKGARYDALPASMSPAIGAPTEVSPNPTHINTTAITRTYQHGMVAVNPSSTLTATFTVPAGTWTDQFGTSVSPGTYSMTPISGVVLIKSN